MDRKSTEELEHDIRRTRAEMSDTVNEIERRLSPERLKREAKETVHETIDEVQDRFHPQRIAEQAGRNMMDAVKDHPIPSIIAGLSLGYLFMKAGEGSTRDRRYYDYDRGRYTGRPYYGARTGYAPASTYRGGYDYERDYYAESYYTPYPADAGSRYGDGYEESMMDRARGMASDRADHVSDTADDMTDKARSAMDHAADQASDMAHEAQRQAQHAGRQVRYRARRAQSGLDDFVHENPLAAGAIAIGLGALLGGMLPSTRRENELMGETRDEAVHRAERAARRTMDQAKETAKDKVAHQAESAARHTMDQAEEAAGHVAHETKDAAEEVANTAKSEAHRVAESAKEGAAHVKDEAKHQMRQNS